MAFDDSTLEEILIIVGDQRLMTFGRAVATGVEKTPSTDHRKRKAQHIRDTFASLGMAVEEIAKRIEEGRYD